MTLDEKMMALECSGQKYCNLPKDYQEHFEIKDKGNLLLLKGASPASKIPSLFTRRQKGDSKAEDSYEIYTFGDSIGVGLFSDTHCGENIPLEAKNKISQKGAELIFLGGVGTFEFEEIFKKLDPLYKKEGSGHSAFSSLNHLSKSIPYQLK